MKLLLIKVGKAWHTLKKEGLLRGSRRIFKAFFAMFKRVGRGDILFITGGVGDSAKYRTENVAEELKMNGFKCSITVQDNPLLPKYADKFKIFIFHRTLFSKSVESLIAKIKKQNKEIIFETDDLVFDSKYLKHMDFFKKMNFFEKKLYENGVGGEILKDNYVKICTTTTDFLAEKLRMYNKKVFVVKNKLPESDLQMVSEIEINNEAERYFAQEAVVLGYFSGAHSHDKDFSTIENVIIDLFKKFDKLRLFLGGPLEISEKFDNYKNRIVKIPYVPRRENYKNIAGIDINLAPLEKDNPFCEAKSELKFFEAGILKKPTVATATQTFKEAIDDGINGFVAENETEWRDKLEKLIANGYLRKQMGERAYEKSKKIYTNKIGGKLDEEYFNYLKTRLKEIGE